MIGIIGGTGAEGVGLAIRWARAGEEIGIGSRIAERARAGADEILAQVPESLVRGDTNEAIAAAAEVVVIAVPAAAVQPTVSTLRPFVGGKLIVSVVAAIEFREGRPWPITVSSGSIAEQISELLPDSSVTSGFHTLSAEKLAQLSEELDEDTIICGNDRDSRREIMRLGERMTGVRAISGGRLANSYYLEQAVGMLAILNRIHKAHAGIRLVGIGQGDSSVSTAMNRSS